MIAMWPSCRIASKLSRAPLAAYAMCLVSDGQFDVTVRTGVTLKIAKRTKLWSTNFLMMVQVVETIFARK